jgi:hypothetical protein
MGRGSLSIRWPKSPHPESKALHLPSTNGEGGNRQRLGFHSEAGEDWSETRRPAGPINYLFPLNDPAQQPLSFAREELEIGLIVRGPSRAGCHEVSHTSQRPLIAGQKVQMDVQPEHRIPKGGGLSDHNADFAPMDRTRAVTL